jgi:uncharacterized protein (TIGR02996 family)
MGFFGWLVGKARQATKPPHPMGMSGLEKASPEGLVRMSGPGPPVSAGSEEESFVQSVREAPQDEARRLVFADWLEERGDVRADFLRIESRLRGMDARETAYPAATARGLELRDGIEVDWVDGLGWRVNALLLPRDLVDLLADGRWGSVSEMDLVKSPWGIGLHMYSHQTMGPETVNIYCGLQGVGTPDPEHAPGNIEPRLTVLIGDEGMGSDAPFALDYRVSFAQPRVLVYRWQYALRDAAGNRWVEVAPDFPAFWDRLGKSRA